VPGFDSPYEASNPFNASIELDNKKFIYVNIGILQANECLEKFAGFDGSGKFYLIYLDFQQKCRLSCRQTFIHREGLN